VEELGNHAEVAAEVALCPFGDALTALQGELAVYGVGRQQRAYPCDQHVLGQGRVGVLYFDKGKLDAAVGEFVYQVGELALWWGLAGCVAIVA
jgi:hypothetical protein